MKRRLRPLKKASAWLGHEVRQGTQSYGTIGGFVFDSSRLHFAVTLTGADEGSVLPVRLLDWKEDGVLSVQEGAQPQPLTPAHRPVFGLLVEMKQGRGVAYVHDLWIDPASSRVAAFQLAALPGLRAEEHLVCVPGEEIERCAGTLLTHSGVQQQLTQALHTPVSVA